jgi:hypothetical protein
MLAPDFSRVEKSAFHQNPTVSSVSGFYPFHPSYPVHILQTVETVLFIWDSLLPPAEAGG